MSLDIIVWGKKGCGKCDKAKEKLVHMDTSFSYKDAQEKIIEGNNPDWRDDGSVDALVLLAENNMELMPIINIINHDIEYEAGRYKPNKYTAYNYSGAMKKLKKISKEIA